MDLCERCGYDVALFNELRFGGADLRFDANDELFDRECGSASVRRCGELRPDIRLVTGDRSSKCICRAVRLSFDMFGGGDVRI